jgi:hypothetical protein
LRPLRAEFVQLLLEVGTEQSCSCWREMFRLLALLAG